MGLKEIVQNAALSAFNSIGNLKETVTYKARTSSGYTPGSGPTGGTSSYTVTKAVFIDYKSNEIDGEVIRANDRRLLILASDLAVTPKTDDWVERTGGEIWVIKNIGIDPAQAVWDLQTRKQ